MPSLNVAQIKNLTSQIQGRSITDQEAQSIMGSTAGGDPGLVQKYLQAGAATGGATTAATSVTPTYAGLPGVGAGAGAVNIVGTDGFPSFSFNFGEEQRIAYEQLRPFYEKLLDFAGGDVNLAKREIETSYQQGMRESTATAEESRKELALTQPVETEQVQTGQLRRGVYSSGFGQTERQRLSDQQQLRREAVERALQERTSRLESEKSFGTEKQDRALEQEKFGLERERRQEASGLASDKFGIKSTQYQAAVSEAQRAENKRIQAEQNKRELAILKAQSPGVDFSGV